MPLARDRRPQRLWPLLLVDQLSPTLASISNSDGSVAKVAFYNGDALLS